MENKAYLLIFDRDPTRDYEVLHNAIKNDRNIKNWWHYIKSAYLLITPLSTIDLTHRIEGYMPSHRFLIFNVTGKMHNGRLPQEAWDWINKYIPVKKNTGF